MPCEVAGAENAAAIGDVGEPGCTDASMERE